MNRFIWLIPIVVCSAALALAQPNEFNCDALPRVEGEEPGQPFWLPIVNAIVKVIVEAKGIPIDVALKIDLGYDYCVAISCNCEPCCNPPAFFLDDPTEFFASVALFGTTAPPTDPLRRGSEITFNLASNACPRKIQYGQDPLCYWPDACKTCFRSGTAKIHITAGLEWLSGLTKTKVAFGISHTCRCKPAAGYCQYASHNHPPSVTVPNPIVFQGSPGGGFMAWVDDEDDDVILIRAVDEKGRNLPVEYRYDSQSWAIRGARIEVPADSERVSIWVEDRCGNAVRITQIPVHVNNPVRLSVSEEKWEYGAYVIRGEAFDKDLIRCADELDLFEQLTFTCGLVSSGGGEFGNAFGQST